MRYTAPTSGERRPVSRSCRAREGRHTAIGTQEWIRKRSGRKAHSYWHPRVDQEAERKEGTQLLAPKSGSGSGVEGRCTAIGTQEWITFGGANGILSASGIRAEPCRSYTASGQQRQIVPVEGIDHDSGWPAAPFKDLYPQRLPERVLE
jgi:hypothetical protein